MPELTTVVATAVSCSVLFVVSGVVGTIVWVRSRQEKLSMAVAQARSGRYARGLQNFPADTVTELSREEGSALRQYGQLPYGRPTEWGLLASRESLAEDGLDVESGSLAEKARSLRHSISLTRSISRRLSKTMMRPRRLSSLATLTEASEKHNSTSTKPSFSKDDVSVSAIEGVLELPAETTPRHTPDREEPVADTCMRPISGVWPLLNQREHTNTLFPVPEDQQYSRVRGGSITAQTAGTMPEQPVPPPPVAYPPNRFRMSKNDSTMRLSSLSLDTADSSILEEAMRASSTVDGDFASPNLPPCPTFMPYSANDVGRDLFTPHTSLPASFAFPANSISSEAHRLEPDRTSPRRSLTARSPSHSSERVSSPPRRSESLSTSQSRRESRLGPLGPAPPLYPTTPHSHSMGSAGLLPHFSQMQRHSMYDVRQRDHDPFYGNHPNTIVKAPDGPGKKSTSFIVHETPLTADSVSRQHPPSAMKGGAGPRKGHRRQNCVRISIHPPITFGGPVFSPMAEEPEEMEELEPRTSVSSLSASHNSPLPSSSISSISMGRSSYQDSHRDSCRDSRRGRPRTSDISIDDAPRASYRRDSSRKRRHTRTDSIDNAPGRTESVKALPDIMTTLPSTEETSLSRTPSPEKSTLVWAGSNNTNSPTTYENSPSTGSPRRSVIKGPRMQPPKAAQNSVQRSSMSIPLGDNAPTTSATPSARPHPVRISSLNSRRSNSINLRNNDSTPQARDKDGTAAPSCDVKKAPSSAGNNSNIVTIWEDQRLERSPPKEYLGPVELHGESSPSKVERQTSHKRTDQAFTTRQNSRIGNWQCHTGQFI